MHDLRAGGGASRHSRKESKHFKLFAWDYWKETGFSAGGVFRTCRATPDGANLIRIVQTRDQVAIVQEKFHETRIVLLDGRPLHTLRILQLPRCVLAET
jgi:hypothetical protein